MENYQTKDQIGRDIFKKLIDTTKNCKIIQFAPGDVDHWDCLYSHLNKDGVIKIILVEIKVRNNHSNDYDWWILEQSKIDGLKEFYKQNYFAIDKVEYLNIFSDKIIIWNISEEIMNNNNNNLEFEYKYCKKNSFGEATKNKLVYRMYNKNGKAIVNNFN